MEIPIPAMPEYLEQLNLSVQAAKEAYFGTFDQVQQDEEGFIICAVHRVRRMGWRSPLHGPNHTMTDLELEKFTVWGERPRRRKHPLPISRVPDLRPHIYE